MYMSAKWRHIQKQYQESPNTINYDNHLQVQVSIHLPADISHSSSHSYKVIPKNSYVNNNFRAKIIGRRIFQSILFNNNTLIIIKNTDEKNCCNFSIEYRSGNIIYCNKTLQIVACDVTFCFFDNLDVTALKSSSKPRVAGCARMRENFVQFLVNKKTKNE